MMKTRVREIDIMKGLLVLAMILCHCIQFFGDESAGLQKYLADFINLTTFSGFLFCFGYVCELIYYQKSFRKAAVKMGKNAVRMLFAFYISGIAYIAFAQRKSFSFERIYRVLLLWEYPGWSEFLASFAAVLAVGIVLYPLMKRMNGKVFLGITVVSLVGCFLPYEQIHNPYLALLAGSKDYITFPVLQYGVFFAAGVWFCKKKTSWDGKTLAAAVLAGTAFGIYYVSSGSLPGRFPPGILFICGGIAGVYLYRLLSLTLKMAAEKSQIINRAVSAIENIGMNSLFYLLMSNLLIFAMEGSKFKYPSRNFAYAYDLIILFILYYFRGLMKQKDKK